MSNISNIALEKRIKKLESKLENQVAVDMTLVYYKVDQLEKSMNARIDSLDKNIEEMDKKLDVLVDGLIKKPQ